MVATGDGSNNVNDDAGESPAESGDLGSPVSEDLGGQSEGVVVGNVVRDDRESEENETEFSETSCGSQDCAEKATDGAVCVRGCPIGVDSCSSHASSACLSVFASIEKMYQAIQSDSRRRKARDKSRKRLSIEEYQRSC